MKCENGFSEWEVCGKDQPAILLAVLLHLNYLFVQNILFLGCLGGLGTLVLSVHILPVGGSSYALLSVPQEVGCILTVPFHSLRIIIVHVDEPL